MQAFLGPAAARAGQRLVLRHAEPRAGGDLRLLGIVNFAHGALYMIGAYVAWMGLETVRPRTTGRLLLAPLVVGALGVLVERTHAQGSTSSTIYGLLLTFGLALIAEGIFRDQFGVSGPALPGARAAAGRHQPGLHDPAQLPRPGSSSPR